MKRKERNSGRLLRSVESKIQRVWVQHSTHCSKGDRLVKRWLLCAVLLFLSRACAGSKSTVILGVPQSSQGFPKEKGGQKGETAEQKRRRAEKDHLIEFKCKDFWCLVICCKFHRNSIIGVSLHCLPSWKTSNASNFEVVVTDKSKKKHRPVFRLVKIGNDF